MLLPKSLIYRDRTYRFLTTEDLHHCLFIRIDDYLEEQGHFNCRPEAIRKYIAAMLNAAMYICTEALAITRPKKRMYEYREYCQKVYEATKDYAGENYYSQSESIFSHSIFSIVYFLLDSCFMTDEQAGYIYVFTEELICNHIPKDFNILHGLCHNPSSDHMYLDSSKFQPRSITKEDLDNIPWEELTENYDPSYIPLIVNGIGSTHQEKLLVVDAIRFAAEQSCDDHDQFVYCLDKIRCKILEGRPLVNPSEPTVSPNASLTNEMASSADELLLKIQKLEQLLNNVTQQKNEAERLLKKLMAEKEEINDNLLIQSSEKKTDIDTNNSWDGFIGSPRQVILLFKELGLDFTNTKYVNTQVAKLFHLLMKTTKQNFRERLGDIWKNSAQNEKDLEIVRKIIGDIVRKKK